MTAPRSAPAERGARLLSPWLYLPTLLFDVGQGAIAPIVALSALELGASVWQAGLVVAVLGVGQLLGDIPAGAVAARFGERRAMLGASAVVVASLAVCAVSTSLWLLAVAVAVDGFATAVWGLARQAYITDVAPLAVRGRALSTLAGARRFGFFLGPFIGAAAVEATGTAAAYWVHVLAAVVASLVLLAQQDGSGPQPAAGRGPSTLGVVRAHLPVLRTLGTAALLVGATRASRQTALPLWAAHIGLDSSATSLVFAIGGLADLVLFYPAGRAMDRHGRRLIGIPAMLVLGVALLLLPLARDPLALVVVAILLGVGNGLSSGLLMVLGSDASPAAGRARFLGAWRLCSDAGTGAGPLLLAGVAAASSLVPAVLVMGGVGLLAGAALHRWIPRDADTVRAGPDG